MAGGWEPYWRYDAICLEKLLAERADAEFALELLPVAWHASSPGDAMQIVVPPTEKEWFDPDQLAARLSERHGRSGALCAECEVWKWMPAQFGELPAVVDASVLEGFDIVASPEWFGDGLTTYRQILVRRGLAELIQSASPRDFAVEEVAELRGIAGSVPEWVPGGFAVPAGAVSDIFSARFLANEQSPVVGVPSREATVRADRARKLLEQSGGLVSADALASIGQHFFDAGEREHALLLWRQAADHGSEAARTVLDRDTPHRDGPDPR